VVAAANPVRGRYNAAIPFAANVNLTDPILSRFDILCVVRDVPDPVQDLRLASFVMSSHRASHPDNKPEHLSAEDAAPVSPVPSTDAAHSEGSVAQDLLKKYIAYARANVHPTLRAVDLDKIAAIYADLRQAARDGGIAITVRHIEVSTSSLHQASVTCSLVNCAHG
jgi:DNA replication licensing factor MCM2